MIYLDSAAVVKLVHAEAESAALRDWLDERAETGWISSVLTEIESFRALARYAPAAASSAGRSGRFRSGRSARTMPGRGVRPSGLWDSR